MFADVNEKAIEAMNKDEPDISLEYLKKVNESLIKLEQQQKKYQDIKSGSISSKKKAELSTSGEHTQSSTSPQNMIPTIDPNYKATLYYNLATCYQRLGMLEECVDFLEMATKSLEKKIILLEEEENALLF